MPASDRPRQPTGHGHGHGHGPAEPVSRRVRTLLTILLAPLALAAVLGGILLYPFGSQQATGGELGLNRTPVHAEVKAVAQQACATGGQGENCQVVTVALTDGPGAGATVRVPVPLGPSAPKFTIGDAVVLAFSGEGNPRDGAAYELVDFQRGLPLGVLAAIFAVAVLILARWRGLAALGALALSFLVLMYFMLPAILAGKSPLAVAVVGAGIIMFAALYLTHGFSARTSTAVLGTLVSLVLIGLLGASFVGLTHLTGLDEESTNLITLLGRPVDTRGLLLAGIIIGALGVLDDVTVTQASAVWELRRANPSLNWRKLYAAGLRIGRDHAGSAVNTLFMAYAGAALPMLITFSVSGRTFTEIATTQTLAQEIVRTLIGSIGLVAAVPVTTLLAALVAVREPVDTPQDPDHTQDRDNIPESTPDPDPLHQAPGHSHSTGASHGLGLGTGTGPNLGPGAGPGVGTGPGPGVGTGAGTGPSPGSGSGTGPGSGPGPATGIGTQPRQPQPSATGTHPRLPGQPGPGTSHLPPPTTTGQHPRPTSPATGTQPRLPSPTASDPRIRPTTPGNPAPPGLAPPPAPTVPGPVHPSERSHPALNPASGRWPAPAHPHNPPNSPNPAPAPNLSRGPAPTPGTGQWPVPEWTAPDQPRPPHPAPPPGEPPYPTREQRRFPPSPSQQWESPPADHPEPEHPTPPRRSRHRRD
ncbi:YibE/F family protein [Crossiella cryophila]|uniref:Putative membrane protein n=1 Tax=Crossiella cryophila TaxID=43355 RepID=A0A7W7FUJ1_9PSEU|nr:YibE/F family protein [Crossiella cryophila]MBB4679356.1 putative membrane protein [Crossiella cryophila]